MDYTDEVPVTAKLDAIPSVATATTAIDLVARWLGETGTTTQVEQYCLRSFRPNDHDRSKAGRRCTEELRPLSAAAASGYRSSRGDAAQAVGGWWSAGATQIPVASAFKGPAALYFFFRKCRSRCLDVAAHFLLEHRDATQIPGQYKVGWLRRTTTSLGLVPDDGFHGEERCDRQHSDICDVSELQHGTQGRQSITAFND